MEEKELLYQLKQGNREAFATLVSQYQRSVINICYRFLLNRADAEDVSQEVFIEVFHSLPGFRGDAKLHSWIYRIAVTKCLDELKRRKRKKRISSAGKTIGLGFIIDLIISNERPDHSMEEKEKFAGLMDALDQLPENQRTALTLSKIEGYTSNDIAELMHVTPTAVDSLIYRARKNLKIILDGLPPESV